MWPSEAAAPWWCRTWKKADHLDSCRFGESFRRKRSSKLWTFCILLATYMLWWHNNSVFSSVGKVVGAQDYSHSVNLVVRMGTEAVRGSDDPLVIDEGAITGGVHGWQAFWWGVLSLNVGDPGVGVRTSFTTADDAARGLVGNATLHRDHWVHCEGDDQKSASNGCSEHFGEWVSESVLNRCVDNFSPSSTSCLYTPKQQSTFDALRRWSCRFSITWPYPLRLHTKSDTWQWSKRYLCIPKHTHWKQPQLVLQRWQKRTWVIIRQKTWQSHVALKWLISWQR